MTKKKRNPLKKQSRVRSSRKKRKTSSASLPAAYTTQSSAKFGKLRTLRIKHKELVRTLNSGETGSLNERIKVNPGRSSAFPWLSTIAPAFEKYNWNHLRFFTEPTCATTVSGSIVLAPEYDPDDSTTGVTREDLLAFEDSVAGSFWSRVKMNCTPRNLHSRKIFYVDTNSSTSLVRSFRPLDLIVDLEGTPGTIVGHLFVEYDITLETPQRPDIDSGLVVEGSGAAQLPFSNVTTTTTIEAAVTDYNTLSIYESGKFQLSDSFSTSILGNIAGMSVIEGDGLVDPLSSMGLNSTMGAQIVEVFSAGTATHPVVLHIPGMNQVMDSVLLRLIPIARFMGSMANKTDTQLRQLVRLKSKVHTKMEEDLEISIPAPGRSSSKRKVHLPASVTVGTPTSLELVRFICYMRSNPRFDSNSVQDDEDHYYRFIKFTEEEQMKLISDD